MSYHPPREKGEGAVFTYLHVCEEKSYDHSSQVHPPLHPGGQGSGVPNQSDPSPVGGQCGPPPLPIRRGARPVLFSFPPPLFPSPLRMRELVRRAQGTSPWNRPLYSHGTSKSHWGAYFTTPPPGTYTA